MDRITDRTPAFQKYSDHMEADQEDAHQGDSDLIDSPNMNTYMGNGYRKSEYQGKNRMAAKKDEGVQNACSALLRLLGLDPLST